MPARVLRASMVVWVAGFQTIMTWPIVVRAEVGVPEDQVAGPLVAGVDAGAVAGGQPAALRGGGAGHADPDLGVRGLGEGGAVAGARAVRAHPVRVADVAVRPAAGRWRPGRW